MPYLVGVCLAIAVCVFGTLTGLDRERAFYATVTIVVASYYVLFAVMGGSTSALLAECGVGLVFVAGAVVGFRRAPWLLAALLAGHGILDAVHHRLIDNPGLPPYWPAFCLAFDVAAGAYLAVLLQRRAAPA